MPKVGAVAATTPAGGEALATGTTPPPSPVPDTESSVLAELDALIGLGEVKSTIRQLLALQHLNEERAKAGLPQVNPSKHLVFTGDPGTGKTTVAKLVARLYKATGVVSKGHLVEAGRADLVAGYVGQTAIKVQEVVRRAIGGVLFIDEAYALATDGFVDFGDEAIATLVQMMEEHRGDLAVIVAGYSEEMRTFIESNPGLRSRFTHYVHFPNYSAEELVEIFRSIAAGSDVVIGPGSRNASARWSRRRRRPVTSATPATSVPSSRGPMPAWRPVPSPTGRSRPRNSATSCPPTSMPPRPASRPAAPTRRAGGTGSSRGRSPGGPAPRQRTRRYVLSDRRATLRTTTSRSVSSTR